ncbi:SDR family NAD(P)-dependent oxidoreductase [Streptomyces canus]|uniref:SDR family NAD(P)-dependent oxidoreductase n=1 Tax=Streptomyces canus TaxID=58343 RepID=UPI003716DD63
MKAQGSGSMAAVTSVAAKEARRAYVPYNASTAAVLNICWSLALELGPDNVSVNANPENPRSRQHRKTIRAIRDEPGRALAILGISNAPDTHGT